MKFMVINGPNINMIGVREKVYMDQRALLKFVNI